MTPSASLRLLAVWVVFVLAAPLALPYASAASDSDGSASGRYMDDDRSRYEGYIEAASAAGLVAGCNPPVNDRFCPHRQVSRSEAALLLSRVVSLPEPTKDWFSDDDGLLAESAINGLAEAGVTRGCAPGLFCPDRPLTRGAFAQLVVRAMGWDEQADVSPWRDLEGSPFAGAAAVLAARGALEPCDLPAGVKLCPDSLVSRDEAVFALAVAVNLEPVFIRRSSNAPELGFLDSFDALRLWDGSSPSARNRVSLTERGWVGSGLDVSIPKGSHFGADFKLKLHNRLRGADESLYFRYFIRFHPDWEPHVSGKLPGFAGVYSRSGKGGFRSTSSEPGWSARVKFGPSRPTDRRARLGYYVYHLGQERSYGDGMTWNEAGWLVPGEWYCVEGQVELNTPGVPDGALRAWVDGTPVFDAAGIEFRRSDEPEISIESFWFNVYYGGKPPAPKDMKVTFDEVAVDGKRIGCGRDVPSAFGDVDGDGFVDEVRWEECSVSWCFTLTSTERNGARGIRELGNGAWFSLETARLGVVVADVDGDGDGDVVYRGRCARSARCWRVHRFEDGKLGRGEDWGDDARFVSGSRLIAGDWDGDGRDDIAYRGECGDDSRPCWRVHLSLGDRFAPAQDWGVPPDGWDVAPEAVDVNGDGADDLVFGGVCGEGSCWFRQVASPDPSSAVLSPKPPPSRFSAPESFGYLSPAGRGRRWWVDANGDGFADLVTVGEGGRLLLRVFEGGVLGHPSGLVPDREVLDVRLRRTDMGVDGWVLSRQGSVPYLERRHLFGSLLLTEKEAGSLVFRHAAELVMSRAAERGFPIQ